MTPSFFNLNAEDAFDLFVGTAVRCVDDLYDLDGEIAFRRRGGTVETFDYEALAMGGE